MCPLSPLRQKARPFFSYALRQSTHIFTGCQYNLKKFFRYFFLFRALTQAFSRGIVASAYIAGVSRLMSAIYGGVFFMVALASVRAHWLDDAPSIVVSASWLKEFGFEIGAKVVIEVTQGVVTIKPVDCEEEG